MNETSSLSKMEMQLSGNTWKQTFQLHLNAIALINDIPAWTTELLEALLGLGVARDSCMEERNPGQAIGNYLGDNQLIIECD